MKKIYLIFIAIIIVISGAYFYIRFAVLKAKDFKPDYSKSKSIIDMRPAIIAKLQQLVKDGSGGLYYLSIGKMDLHILASSIDITNAVLTPDSERIKDLNKAHALPDDIFKISFSSLHIDGVGINDVLSKDHLLLKRILITGPVIEVYHKEKGYNKELRIKNDTATLYKKIMKKMKSISIDTIEVLDGAFISHLFSKKYQTNKLNDVSIIMNDVLIDSSTQYDTKRFLFAKQANLSTKNFYGRTPDSLYYFKCSSIDISTTGNNLTALNIELHPRENRQQFESHLKQRKEIYNLTIPKITVSGINWWDLANQKNIIANEATISNASCDIFLDRSLPFRKVKVNNFPHQILMRLPVPLSITKMHIRHCNLAYSEHNPGIDKTGTVYIDDMNGEVTNITNMHEQIKKHKILVIKSSGLFMHKIPMTNGFTFNLSKYKTGDFTMDLNIGAIDSSVLNPITEPMGEFMIQKGSIQKGIAHVIGNNFKGGGKGELLYKDLYLVGLKKDKNNPGGIKKKSLVSFFGNVFLIKNNNPKKDEAPRVVNFDLKRESKTTFFSLVWGTIFSGILKTIGLPPGFADKPY
jgi:hypothetical protein